MPGVLAPSSCSQSWSVGKRGSGASQPVSNMSQETKVAQPQPRFRQCLDLWKLAEYCACASPAPSAHRRGEERHLANFFMSDTQVQYRNFTYSTAVGQ